MEYIKVTEENIDKEHICCAIANDKDVQVVSKKAWLKERFQEGLVFLKGDIRGKCFIEYIPAENAWVPIKADNYMHINCFWVSGSCKGNGYSNDLLEQCIADAKNEGKSGITVISSHKKQSYLSDPKYLSYKGFQVVDTAPPFFTLMCLSFDDSTELPKFKECVKNPQTDKEGFTLYYTSGCPFTAKFVPVLEKYALSHQIPFRSVHLDSKEKAQNAPMAWTNYALFYNGEYVTNEILNEKKFQKIYDKIMH